MWQDELARSCNKVAKRMAQGLSWQDERESACVTATVPRLIWKLRLLQINRFVPIQSIHRLRSSKKMCRYRSDIPVWIPSSFWCSSISVTREVTRFRRAKDANSLCCTLI